MSGTYPGHSTDVEERWQALRAGVTGRAAAPGGPPVTPARPRRWRRTRRAVVLLIVVSAFSGASFVAGWVTGIGGLSALPKSGASVPVAAPSAPNPAATAAPGTTDPAPPETAAAEDAYVYRVDSNHRVDLSYTDSRGETVRLDGVDAPWSLEVGTTSWGADTRPNLVVSGADDGDTFVRCEIVDESGHVVASDKEETSSPNALCVRW